MVTLEARWASVFDLGRTFLAAVERSPNEVAVVDGDVRLTYAEWLTRIGAVAGALHSIGLKHGDHLLLALQNRWQTATLHWACQFLGVVVTPLNWRAKADEVEYCALDAEAKAVVFEQVSAAAVAGSEVCRGISRISLAQTDVAATGFGELLAGSPPAALPGASADDWSVMLYTSGTTGRPKGVPRRHRAERAAALAHVAQNTYRKGERTLGVMPLYHTMGVRSLLAMALVDGRFVCMPRFDAGQALALIGQEQISNLYLVPTLYHDLLAHPGFSTAAVGCVRKLGFAGAPMPDALLKRLDNAFRPELFVNHYGIAPQ